MNDNIIKFYIYSNKLKYILRKGWLEVGVSKDRVESVAEHIFGTLILAITISSEYKLDLDMLKVLKMLALHETEEILMPDYTIRSNITREEKLLQGKECVHKVVNGLFSEKEIEALLDEFNLRETKEAKFSYLIDKTECDFQAKIYDLEGYMDYEDTRKDLKYYGSRAKEIDEKSNRASDFWIEYDRPIYKDDEIFKNLISDIKELDLEKFYL